MATRTFTIFQDAPTDAAPGTTTTTIVTRSRSASMTATTTITTLTTLVVESDKENLHPLTGERSAPATPAAGKKRKNSISSSVKALAPIEVKKTKEADLEPDAKKRKPLSAGAATRKAKATPTKKDSKGSAAGRKAGSRRSSRAPSPMPKVDEEVGDEPQDVQNLTQQAIDAKCYALTVKPLADVSQAFSQCSPLAWLEEEDEDEDTEEDKMQFNKEVSQEPELRDLFTPASVGYASLESSCSTSASSSQEPATPERKQPYHSFTFSSPTPIRVSKMMRSGSVPRLDIRSPVKVAAAA